MKAAAGGKGRASAMDSPRTLLSVLLRLEDAYGWRLLGILAFAQWVVKGVVWGFNLTAMDFLLRDYAVPGPKMQVYKAIAMLPWAMKPLFGLLSDYFPIMGYRKAPYIIIVTLVAVAAYSTIGLTAFKGLPVKGAVLSLLFGCMQSSVVDLLTEARYAEKIRERPESGPDLMTYVWGGITVGNLFATGSVGVIIERWGSAAVYSIIALPAATMLLPTCLGWLEESPMRAEEASTVRSRLWEQKELVVLVLLTGMATIAMVLVGLLQDSIFVNLAVALIASVIVISAFLALLRPIISLMNCFFFIQTCCAVDISGASFYFFTNDSVQYPDGPHFSRMFFASGLGVCVSALNLVGMYLYNRYMQHWRYHGMFIFANTLLCLVHLASLMVYTRSNVALGMPDEFFVLGAWGAVGVASMWMWLPGVVMLSHLCPSGVEATMYALLAGCHNLGMSVASYLGACLLETLEVAPRGAPAEQKEFENLWVAGLVSAVLPMLTMLLLPWMIPNARQTESLLKPGSSAIAGSPWQRWTGGLEEDDPGGDVAAAAGLAAAAGAASHYGSA